VGLWLEPCITSLRTTGNMSAAGLDVGAKMSLFGCSGAITVSICRELDVSSPMSACSALPTSRAPQKTPNGCWEAEEQDDL
jgi:hypothetical protein